MLKSHIVSLMKLQSVRYTHQRQIRLFDNAADLHLLHENSVERRLWVPFQSAKAIFHVSCPAQGVGPHQPVYVSKGPCE